MHRGVSIFLFKGSLTTSAESHSLNLRTITGQPSETIMLQAWCIFKWFTVACSWASPQIHTLQSTCFLVWLSQRWDLIKQSLPYLRWGCLEHHPPGTALCFADRNGAGQIWSARQWPQAGDEHHLTALHGTDTPVGTWQSIALCSRNILPLPGTTDAPMGKMPWMNTHSCLKTMVASN